MLFVLPTIEPSSEKIIISIRKSQEIGVLSALRIRPIRKNTVENDRKIKIPHKEPQRSESLFLFFFTAIKPPKNEAVKIEKNEIGAVKECGFSVASPIAENIAISPSRIRVAPKSPKAEEISIPLFEMCLFSVALFFIKRSLDFLLQYIYESVKICKFAGSFKN